MANKIILLDTSVFIDHFRKTNKQNSIYFKLNVEKYDFKLSVISKYEILFGAPSNQISIWHELLSGMEILPLDNMCIDFSLLINHQLKKSRNQIAMADLFIAATAMTYDLPLATLNLKHFN